MQTNVTEELKRLEQQRLLRILDALPKQAYDDVVQLAVALFSVPIASIVLVNDAVIRRKSGVGLSVAAQNHIINYSFASRVIDSTGNVVVIEDALLDAVLAKHPYVVGAPYVRFYATRRSSPQTARWSRSSASWTARCVPCPCSNGSCCNRWRGKSR